MIGRQVKISVVLFFMLYRFFVEGEEDQKNEIKCRLEAKMELMMKHHLYSQSKTADTEEEREKARKEYLDEVKISENFRY